MKESSVEPGGGLSGRKCVWVAEICSAEVDRGARGGLASAGAMMNEKTICTLKAIRRLKMAAVA